MDDETRAAFARIDRWFELSPAQHHEVRQELERQGQQLERQGQQLERQGQQLERHGDQMLNLSQQMEQLQQQVSRLDAGLTALYAEFRSFRDWVTVQFADLRGLIQQLTVRVERLEHRQNDPIG